MLFNSLTFLFFLPIVFFLYWFVCTRSLRLQNLLVVVVSYIFYGWWDWRFLILIAFTSAWAFSVGLIEFRRNVGSKWLLASSLIVNLGILGFFKYYNFFLEQAVAILEVFGVDAHPITLQILLPVGISFYTFQALSYTIDVYRRQIIPTRDPIAFFAFISFFPQLVAGPIERATNLLPQFLKPRCFDYALAVEGCRQMLWGFCKKVIVADSCAFAANSMLNHTDASSITLWAGMICFAFQIYGDFSGYSDIAIGCSKLFGIRLMRNFSYPYFARDIADFWRRWHISLTTWFRDYIYFPLGGSRCAIWKKVRNTFLIFLISGFWHGANWTFIAWGVFHAFCFIPLLLFGKNRKFIGGVVAEGKIFPTWRELLQMGLTFFIVVVGWTFFRATTIREAIYWLIEMFSFSDLNVFQNNCFTFVRAIGPIGGVILLEWINRTNELPRLPKTHWLRWCWYLFIFWLLCYYRSPRQVFIYFQF